MKWQRNMHLTDDQIEFIKIGGGAIKVTSLKTGISYGYTITRVSSGKGLVVRLIDGRSTKYVGYIPFNNQRIASDSFINTSASEFGIKHEVFKTFLWVWTNKHSDSFSTQCLLTNV